MSGMNLQMFWFIYDEYRNRGESQRCTGPGWCCITNNPIFKKSSFNRFYLKFPLWNENFKPCAFFRASRFLYGESGNAQDFP